MTAWPEVHTVEVMAIGDRRFFLVERYIPSMRSGSVGPAVQRLRQSASGTARHLYSVLVRDEETCLSVFEADDARAVEAANQSARFEVDRIVEVEVFPRPSREEALRTRESSTGPLQPTKPIDQSKEDI
jgi:hypothetical protein